MRSTVRVFFERHGDEKFKHISKVNNLVQILVLPPFLLCTCIRFQLTQLLSALTVALSTKQVSMSQAKKRRVGAKQAADSAAIDVDVPSSDDVSALQKHHAETMSNLQSDLESLASTPAGAARDDLIFTCSISLCTLKLLQRQISLEVANHHASVAKEGRAKVEACSLMLQNLNYERNYLRREIEELKGWKAEDLEKMAGDELGLDLGALAQSEKSADGDDVHMDDVDSAKSPEDAIDSYFLGDVQQSHRDPANHEAMLAKFQEAKVTRSSLVDQLSKSKSELKDLQKKREELRNFLTQIPKKLGEMEKIGEGLSGFFEGCKAEWLCNEKDSAKKKLEAAKTLSCPPSLKRSDRFQLARSRLPSPLYTLFVQLTGYIDAWSMVDHLDNEEKDACNLGEFVGADGMSVVASPSDIEGADGTSWSVELSLPTAKFLPDEIASLLGRPPKAGGESIKIVFSYDADQGVVLARVADEMNCITCNLLDHLFPGDDGLVGINVPSTFLKPEEDEPEVQDPDEMQESDAISSGKPYHWCQIISGIIISPPSSQESTGISFQANICTKAVFRQLLRRIRARSSLAALLEFLGRRGQNLPIHPAFRTDEYSSLLQPKAKLVLWAEEKDSHHVSLSPSMKRYVATIKRKTSTLKAAVTIDMDNYPAEPPIWSLQNEDGTTTSSATPVGDQSGDLTSLQESGNPPLFDATLHRIESRVNSDLDQFVTQDVETTYDWILMHQLVDIVSCWDDMLSASEGTCGVKTNGFDSQRLRKGKDRQLVGVGEHSPFFYYRHGM